MKKFLVLAIVIALLLSVGPLADASVGYQKDGVNSGNIMKIDFQKGFTSFDGSTVTFYASGYKGGVTTSVSTESNLTSAALAYGVIVKSNYDGTSDQKVTLADGSIGQMLTLTITALGSSGDWVITDDAVGTAITKTGWDDITLGDALDSITLLYLDDTVGWIIVGNNGCTIS